MASEKKMYNFIKNKKNKHHVKKYFTTERG